MRQLKYIHAVLAVLASWALVSCTIDERYPVVGERESVVTFTPVLSGDMQTRAIGDATKINQLVVCVFEGSTQVLRQDLPWSQVSISSGVSLTLIEGRTYNILFWAQYKDNGAYAIDENGRISVTYDSFLNGGFSAMEKMDAFYAVVKNVTIGSAANQARGTITLTRPLAQVNFADNTTQPEMGTHKAIVTFHSIATSFNPFTGEVEMLDMDKAFVFTDFPTETLLIDGYTYYYLSSNYFFTPQTGTININATIDLQNTDGSSIKTVELSDITLEKNKKTNVTGSIIQQPETWSVWDGNTKTEPTVDAENRYVIDEASDLAWLAENGLQLTERTKFLQTKDIDMASKAITSIKLPTGSTYDGGGKTIKNFANSLFGDATSLTVKDLAVENITASGSTHIGTLVNNLNGSSSFTNVSVTNSSATTTAGAAGGMVGYIVRTSEMDREETLSVSFSGCKLNGVTVSGSASEGKFVGLLSGYDNNEALSFDTECEAADVSVADYTSVYTKTNNSVWVTGDVTNKYDGWLGAENYRRAKVTFGGVRMVPRWDGKTVTAKIDLLLYNGENNKYEVHSPFDLAGVRNATATPAALYLMENVDMFGQGEDGEFFVHSNFTKSACNSPDDNNFDAFTSIALLDGNGKAIYNLALNSKGSDRYAFILSGDNGHVHQNVSFYNSCTVVPHIVGKDGDQTVDKSYGATVVLSIGGATYNMKNVHAYDCKVFALQKTGIIAGRIVSSGMATLENCSVTNGYIENYKCEEHIEIFKRDPITAEFYSYGEIGGLVGFVDYNATIKGCKVLMTKLDAYGQGEKSGKVTVSGYPIDLGSIPGRHVNQFIGDIRSREGYSVTITDTEVKSNLYGNRKDEHEAIIGRAYYLGASVWLIFTTKTIGDKPGTVTLQNINVDGSVKYTSKKKVTLKSVLG